MPIPPQPIYPKVFANFPILVAAQSTRVGGFSEHPYHGLNLGSHTSDDPGMLIKNKELFCAQLGFDLSQSAKSHQVHGDAVLEVLEAGSYEGYDALVTKQRGILLTVSTADCVPMLVYDPVKETIAAVHAGWKGTLLDIVGKTIRKMKEIYGCRAEDMRVYIGACIDRCHFEVGPEVWQQFEAPYRRLKEDNDKGHIDLKQVNFDLLTQMGVKEQNIEVSPYCTFDREDLFYSHRRDRGITGRMWSVIGFL